tara:strand:+ start:17566 stop:19068 length:1503 start_codon:yes stop_codon:yes gene_type:complete
MAKRGQRAVFVSPTKLVCPSPKVVSEEGFCIDVPQKYQTRSDYYTDFQKNQVMLIKEIKNEFNFLKERSRSVIKDVKRLIPRCRTASKAKFILQLTKTMNKEFKNYIQILLNCSSRQETIGHDTHTNKMFECFNYTKLRGKLSVHRARCMTAERKLLRVLKSLNTTKVKIMYYSRSVYQKVTNILLTLGKYISYSYMKVMAAWSAMNLALDAVLIVLRSAFTLVSPYAKRSWKIVSSIVNTVVVNLCNIHYKSQSSFYFSFILLIAHVLYTETTALLTTVNKMMQSNISYVKHMGKYITKILNVVQAYKNEGHKKFKSGIEASTYAIQKILSTITVTVKVLLQTMILMICGTKPSNNASQNTKRPSSSFQDFKYFKWLLELIQSADATVHTSIQISKNIMSELKKKQKSVEHAMLTSINVASKTYKTLRLDSMHRKLFQLIVLVFLSLGYIYSSGFDDKKILEEVAKHSIEVPESITLTHYEIADATAEEHKKHFASSHK